MIVVDSNILAHLYLPGPFTPAAESLLQSQPQWAAPVLWRSEFRNILAGYLRRNMLSFEQVCSIQAEAESLMMGMEYEVPSSEVLELVRQSNCSAYDCEFVALAMRMNMKLVTMDRKVLGAFAPWTLALDGAQRQ